MPVLVTLRTLAAGYHKRTPGRARTLWDFIVTRLEAQNRLATEALHARLEQGQAILLLDGLDEIPTAQQRTFIRDAVAVFARRYPSVSSLPAVRCPTRSGLAAC